MYFVWISGKNSDFFLVTSTDSFCITEMDNVYLAVGIESLPKTNTFFVFKG